MANRLAQVVFALALLVVPRPAFANDRGDSIPDGTIAHGQRNIAEAWFAAPTDRYRHFVLGTPYEPSALVVKLRDGKVLRLTLPEDSVFEDREPRLADLDGDGDDEIVVVRSYIDRGAALAVVSVRDGELKIIAETAPIGTPNRWLNPAGIGDFDGDGRLDIAYVDRPHILGLLRIVTLRDGKLFEIAQAPGFSNHVAGSRAMRLSWVLPGPLDDTRSFLSVPRRDRSAFRIVSVRDGRIVDEACVPVAGAIDGNVVFRGSDLSRLRLGIERTGSQGTTFEPVSNVRHPPCP